MSRPKQRRDRSRPLAPALLVVAERQVHRPPRTESARRQCFDRFENSEYANLVVQRTSPPDIPARDGTAERRIGPLRSIGRHDILMRRKKHGWKSRLRAGPGVE